MGTCTPSVPGATWSGHGHAGRDAPPGCPTELEWPKKLGRRRGAPPGPEEGGGPVRAAVFISVVLWLVALTPAAADAPARAEAPVVVVFASYPGASAQVVADSIAAPLE